MQLIEGNVLKHKEGIILHGCNVCGGFGSGIAGQIRARYPEAFDAYYSEFGSASLQHPKKERLGGIQPVTINEHLTIVNGFTQMYYGGKPNTKYADVVSILSVLDHTVQLAIALKKNIYTVKIGCGLGGLDWIEVEPIFRTHAEIMADHGLELVVYWM